MKVSIPPFKSIEDAFFRIAAHVLSRLLRRDIRSELRRLQDQQKTKSYLEVAAICAVLFGLAVLAASFGVWGLCVYFAAVVVLFR